MVPTYLLKLITFFSSVKQSAKRLAFLRRLTRIKSSRKKRRWIIFPAHVAVNQATSSIVPISIVATIEGTNTITMTNNPTMVIETINTTILAATIRTLRTASPLKRRMIASTITSRKRAARPCTMTRPLCQAWTSCLERGVAHAQDLLCPFVPGLALARAAGATTPSCVS
jgi:hypothetical protein